MLSYSSTAAGSYSRSYRRRQLSCSVRALAIMLRYLFFGAFAWMMVFLFAVVQPLLRASKGTGSWSSWPFPAVELAAVMIKFSSFDFLMTCLMCFLIL